MNKETGFTICQCGEKIVKGCEAEGKDSSHVSVPVCCPTGCKPVGIFHTHPGGSPRPSDKDISEIKRLNLAHLCISVPERKETKCWRVK